MGIASLNPSYGLR